MSTRQQKGLEIASKKTIKQQGDIWIVPSESGNGEYRVNLNADSPSCTCPDSEKCKHIFAVEYTLRLSSGETEEAIRKSIAPMRKRKSRKQDKSPMLRYTVKNLQARFPNDEACLEWLKDQRWPDGIHCESCGRITKHHLIKERKCYSCQECGTHTHPTADTIFHKSSTSLTQWFHAIYLMSQTRGGISAKQLERELGVTYKTAWRMFTLIRSQLDESRDRFSGKVEADESYFGGKMKGGKRGRGSENKTPVFGVAQREQGQIKTVQVENVQKRTLEPIITETVEAGSTMYTDELLSYNGLTKLGYQHETVKHAQKEFVKGDAHTNRVEGHWGNVKNGIRGVYHHVSKKYLRHYLNEYQFRYNHRNDVQPMFISFLKRVGIEASNWPFEE